MLKIVQAPNPILLQKTKEVKKIDKKIKKIIEEMKETLLAQNDPQGVGLAANQVGVNLSLFIIKPTKNSPISVFINPKILKVEEEKEEKRKKNEKKLKLEGCLSVPKIWGNVKRAKKVLLEYQTDDEIFGKKQAWFSGFEAVIIQHEVDHLEGILFTQRALAQNQPLYEEKEGKLVRIEKY
jgi:peptide deformylase